jgi:hypothetical protein
MQTSFATEPGEAAAAPAHAFRTRPPMRPGLRFLAALAVSSLFAAPPGASALTINVEVDWLASGTHSHRPNPCEIEAVRTAFALRGHSLNVEMGNEVPETPANSMIVFDTGTGFDDFAGGWYALESAYRNHPPGTGWHYCIFVHQYQSGTITTSSGLAEIGGDEFLVSLGAFSGGTGTPFDRAGTFMHELGHNLGLRHGGGQDESQVGQYKPNYPSLMAYRYQLIGVRNGLVCQGLALATQVAPFTELDYSVGAVPDLDETKLNECNGLGLGKSVDWNCNGSISSCTQTVGKDLSSGYNWCTNTGFRTAIKDYNDWAHVSDVSAKPQLLATNTEVISCITADEAASPLAGPGGCTQVNPCDQPTPTLLSLVSALAEPDRVRLTWHAAESGGLEATIYRRTAESEWIALGLTRADGNGFLAFEDRTAGPGQRYGYRLGVMESGREYALGESWVDVPRTLELMLQGLRPNPATGRAAVSFTLPGAGSARLELFDLSGRRVWAREVGSLGAGSHAVPLDEGSALPSGVYVVRLTSGGREVTSRAVVVH